MELKTAKPILAITPPTETGNLDLLENIKLDLDIHCTPKEKGFGSRTLGLSNDDLMKLLKDRLDKLDTSILDNEYEEAEELRTRINECTKGIIFLIILGVARMGWDSQDCIVYIEDGFLKKRF